jgi:predicted transcriptional regulator
MSPSKRKSSTMRLTDECRRLLLALANKKGVSQSAIIEMSVREMAEREKIK